MGPTKIQLLGDVSVTSPEGTRHLLRRSQPRAAFALLVVERSRAVSRDEIADLLWGDDLPGHWPGAVRGVLSKLRGFLAGAGAGVELVTSVDGWRIDVASGTSIDFETAGELLAEAERSASVLDEAVPGDREGLRTAARCAIEAAALFAGAFAPGATGEWLERHRRLVEQSRRRALELATDLALDAGLSGLAAQSAEEILELDPFDERAAIRLGRALLDAHDVSAATDHLARFVARLRIELGADPSPELTELLAQLTPRATQRPAGATPAPDPTTAMFGRDDELGRLLDRWDAVREGGTARLTLVRGEAGSGKTRLAAELARSVTSQSRPVLWTRCSPDRSTSFEPVAAAFETILAGEPAALGRIGAQGDELAAILSSDMARGRSVAGESAPRDPAASGRPQLFGAMARFVTSTLRLPTLWVLDDLHWADPDTVSAMTHLSSHLASVPLHLVLITRGHDAEVAALLEHLSRSIPTDTIELRGLAPEAVGEMLADAGVDSADELAGEVQRRTGGNPFFITQLLDEWSDREELDPTLVPAALRSWLDHRLDALPAGMGGVIAAASVVPERIEVELLAAMTGAEPLAVAEDCDDLARQGYLLAAGSEGAMSFSHVLTRDAVYDRLGPARRQILHARAAAWLDEHEGTIPGPVAHHLELSGRRAHRDPVEVQIAAGAVELNRAAWSAALRWFHAALGTADADPATRAAALVGSGHARRGLGDRTGARENFQAALDLARTEGSGRLAAEATLGLVGGGARGVSDDLPDARRAELLESAIDGLGPDDDDLAVLLLQELAVALLLTDQVDRRAGLVWDAVERARRLDRADLLGSALLGTRVANHDPRWAEERLAVVDEVLALTESLRSPELSVRALVARHEDLMLIGDRQGARDALAAAAEVVADWAHPYWQWVVATWEALGSIVDGELDAAEAEAFAAVELQAEHPEALACLGVNLVAIRLFQGRSEEVVELLSAAAEDNPQIPCYRAVLALCLAEAGEYEAARRQFTHFAAAGFADIPEDTNRLLTLAVLADVAATLEELDAAPALVELLAPHRSRHVVLNCYAGGGSYWGPVATQLGRLARLLGDDDAARLLEEAAAAAEEFGAPLARACVPLG